MGPIATTRKPCEATSDKKFTCSQGEFAHAPLPQAMMGSFAFLPNTPRSFGRKTVWVASVLSDAMRALKGPSRHLRPSDWRFPSK